MDLLQDLPYYVMDFNNVTSSQNSQASSEYLHSLDMGFNGDEAIADALNNCNYEPGTSQFLFTDVSEFNDTRDTSDELVSPGSSCSFEYNESTSSPAAAVENDGTFIHIPEVIDYYNTQVEDIVPLVEHSDCYITPVEDIFPLSVSFEMSTDDEEEDDEEQLGRSVSRGSEMSRDGSGSTISSTADYFTDDYLRSASVKQLNLKIRDLAVSREFEGIVKKRRRTLKNRGYAHSSRQKRNGRHQEVDEVNVKLQRLCDEAKRERDAHKRENDEVKRDRDKYRRENEILKRKVIQLGAVVRRDFRSSALVKIE